MASWGKKLSTQLLAVVKRLAAEVNEEAAGAWCPLLYLLGAFLLKSVFLGGFCFLFWNELNSPCHTLHLRLHNPAPFACK